jgi:hypothetical protein
MKIRVVLAAVLAMGLVGCAHVNTVNVPQPDRLAASETKFKDHATIYVFRGSSRAGVMWSFPVTLDQQKIGSLRREEYLAFPAPPGPHGLGVTCASLCELPGFKLNLNVVAGKTYYFLVEPDIAFGGDVTALSSQVMQIDKRAAAHLLATYDPSDVNAQVLER